MHLFMLGVSGSARGSIGAVVRLLLPGADDAVRGVRGAASAAPTQS